MAHPVMAYPVDVVLRVVPQRYPMLMIDRILDHEYGRRAVCQKNVTLGEEVLSGHFPGNPLFPGVLMIEMGLQATQVMLTELEGAAGAAAEAPPRQGYLLGVSDFRFRKTVRPGDVLRVESVLLQELGGMRKARITIRGDDEQEVCSGTVTVGEAR